MADDNPFVKAETRFSDAMTATLNCYRDIRDRTQEWLFKAIYDTPWMNFWWGSAASGNNGQEAETDSSSTQLRRRELAFARRHARQGGFAEAVVRIILAVAGANRILDKREYLAAENIIRRHSKFQHRTPAEVKQMVHTQARILEANPGLSFSTLADMLPEAEEKQEAYEIACDIALADHMVGQAEYKLLDQIRDILELGR